MLRPIKLRFAANTDDPNAFNRRYFNFEGSINVGYGAGIAINLNKSKFVNRDYLTILGGVSITSVPVDSLTTHGYTRTSTNTAAFTWDVTLLYQRDNFQAGLFFGKDYLAGETGRQWIYRNKPWMGVGIGFTIFQSKKTTGEQ